MGYGIKRETKQTIQMWLAVFMCIFGCTMITLGFFYAPVGEIHNSVLVAFGETLTFAGALIGVEYTYKYKIMSKEKEKNDDECK